MCQVDPAEQTLPDERGADDTPAVGKVAGFSLHAGVAAKTTQRKVRYELKTPYRDGTTHVIFEPVDLIAKLAALIPRPRVNLARFHGVFAPNSKHRVWMTPAKRGKWQKLTYVTVRFRPEAAARYS
jgi:hypothetical protein